MDTEASMLSGISRKRSIRSSPYWFTESCNSQCLSHFAVPFIVARAETSIAESQWESTAKKCNAARKNSSQREGDNKYWKEVTSTHPALLPLSFCMEASMQSPSPHKTSRQYIHNGIKWMRANDPSAGSPTETLLRLLLPLSDKVH